MNERINQLARQCFAITDDGRFDYANRYVVERFAELILRDVDKIINELYHVMPLEQAAVLLTLDENIKEHFYGVEI